jgi:hypothetical protein
MVVWSMLIDVTREKVDQTTISLVTSMNTDQTTISHLTSMNTAQTTTVFIDVR